jgi:hypothetical protein
MNKLQKCQNLFLGEKMPKITIEVEDPSKISDGYHTFAELYSHRMVLFISLMKSYPHISWKSKKHFDNTEYEGYFIAGMKLPTGDITYHIVDKFWDILSNIKTLDVAPEWDGHTSDMVLHRLNKWCSMS